MKLTMESVLASDAIPSLPEVAHRVLRVAQDCKVDVRDLIDVAKADPAISAKILRTANSAYFGRQYKVTSLEAAIPVLGATLIRTLVLGFSLTQKDTWQPLAEAHRRVWRRTVTMAVTARLLARQVPGEDSNGYFIAGLIQDVGVLAMMKASPKHYVDEILNKSTIVTLPDIEQRELAFNHVDVTVNLCKNWQLDDLTTAAIRDHHGTLDLLKSSCKSSPLRQALKLASLCVNSLECNKPLGRESRLGLARTFGIEDAGVDTLVRHIQAEVEDAAGAFTFDIGEVPSIDEILQNARATIEDIAIASQLEADAAKRDASQARDELAMSEDRSRHLESEIFRDPLTGVFNRRVLETELSAEVSECQANNTSMALLFVDLDNFKQLNDRCGHEVGDLALIRVAERLVKSVRDGDLVIRYGGDEFVVVFFGLSPPVFESIASRICDELRTTLQTVSDTVAASASVGGIHCPQHALEHFDLGHLLRTVDGEMYQAKKRGGNQISVLSWDQIADATPCGASLEGTVLGSEVNAT